MYYRILLVGNGRVGKTAALTRFIDDRFPAKYQRTMGADYLSKKIIVDDIKVTLQVWDTAGNEIFSMLSSTKFYCAADACLLFYDVTQLETLQGLLLHVEKIKQYMQRSDYNLCEFILVGNKEDLRKRAVVTQPAIQEVSERIQQILKLNHPLSHCLVSAKTGEGVEQLFEQVTKKLLVTIPVSSLEVKVNQPLAFSKSEAAKQKSNIAPVAAAFITFFILLVLGVIFWPIIATLAVVSIALVVVAAIAVIASISLASWLLADKLPECGGEKICSTSSTQYGLERMGSQGRSDIKHDESRKVLPNVSPLLTSDSDDAYTLMDDLQPQTLRKS